MKVLAQSKHDTQLKRGRDGAVLHEKVTATETGLQGLGCPRQSDCPSSGLLTRRDGWVCGLAPVSSPFTAMTKTTSSVGLTVLAGLLAIVSVHSAGIGVGFQCPDKRYNLYEDSVQCDKYYECQDGRAKEKLCPDGLVFDPNNHKIINRCDQPFNVDCGDRQELQPAKSTEQCPRQNGFFAHPDLSICDIFYTCIEGEATESRCPPGLHFDEEQGVCVWPDSAKREGCRDANSNKLKDGFQCPKEPKLDGNGQALAHPQYAHPTDCQKFYVCLNGVAPREQGCSLGEVYNEEVGKCDDPDNVPECADWYKDDPEVAALKAKAAAKAAAKHKNKN